MGFVLIGISIAAGLAIICSTWFWIVKKPTWMGFHDKTMWDWMQILIIPIFAAIATFLINSAQREIEQSRATETAIQNYLRLVSNVTLNPSIDQEKAKIVGRAQTRTILSVAEGKSAGRVLAFLAEMNLLQDFEIEYEELDFSHSILKGLNFSNTDFEDSSFAYSELERSSFQNADLANVDFTGADLDNTDFRNTDLRTAIGLTEKQLTGSCYNNKTLFPEHIEIEETQKESRGCREDMDSD